MLAVAQDVISLGGFWVIDGQTKTGKLLDEWHREEDVIAAKMELYYLNQFIKESDEKAKE